MSKLRVKLNRKGVSDFMKSYEMQAVLKDCATGINSRCYLMLEVVFDAY